MFIYCLDEGLSLFCVPFCHRFASFVCTFAASIAAWAQQQPTEYWRAFIPFLRLLFFCRFIRMSFVCHNNQLSHTIHYDAFELDSVQPQSRLCGFTQLLDSWLLHVSRCYRSQRVCIFDNVNLTRESDNSTLRWARFLHVHTQSYYLLVRNGSMEWAR